MKRTILFLSLGLILGFLTGCESSGTSTDGDVGDGDQPVIDGDDETPPVDGDDLPDGDSDDDLEDESTDGDKEPVEDGDTSDGDMPTDGDGTDGDITDVEPERDTTDGDDQSLDCSGCSGVGPCRVRRCFGPCGP